MLGDFNRTITEDPDFRKWVEETILSYKRFEGLSFDQVAPEVSMVLKTINVAKITAQDLNNELAGKGSLVGRFFSVQKVISEESALLMESHMRELQDGQREMKQRLSGIPDLLGLEKELSSEYQAQLDTARHYLDTFRPKLALELLQSLKDRIWDKASLLDRYRLITYMGFAYMYQEQNVRAAQMFLDAYTLNRDSTKALANAALGYLLKEEPDRALELAREAIRRDPTIVQAYSTLVWASPGEKRFESVVNSIPVAYQQTAEVAMALGNVAERKGLLEEAEKWFRLAIHVDTEKWPEPRGSLATLLLAKASDKYLAPQTPGIIDPHRDLVEEALELLDYAWECVADTEIRNNRLEWLASRAIARARLGYQDGAAQDLDAALRENQMIGSFSGTERV